MFNEILTGKATLEPKAPVPPPAQEPQPDITLSCLECQREYTAKAGSRQGHCRACFTRIAQQNAIASAAAMREAENNYRKAESSHALMKTLIFVAVAIMLGFIRYQMRKQQREDSARAAGYSSYNDYETTSAPVYPTDEYSYKVQGFAQDMCRCSDLACARTVQAQYTRYIHSNVASDSSARESAEQDGMKLADCQDALESQTQLRTTNAR